MERVNKEINHLLALMHHDLRTPLVSILETLRLLNKTSLSPAAKIYLQDIHLATKYMFSLVDDFLDISKIDAGKMKLISHAFDFREAIFKKIKLKKIIDSKIPSILLGDERAIKQIVSNLVGNAIKHTQQGEVTLEINLQDIKKYSVELKIIVKDTGIGIPEDQLQFIFAPYVQGGDVIAHRRGTGLGLALCKEYLDLMQGCITVESKVGLGTQFICEIPFGLPATQNYLQEPTILQVAEEPAEYITQPLEVPLSENISYHEKLPRILLVEDNIIVQRAHLRLFQEMGYDVDVIDQGGLAFDKIIKNKNYDFVFIDLNLPDCEGVEIAKRIRAWEENNARKRLPLIALTAITNQDVLLDCLSEGMVAVLTKPLELNELSYVMKTFLSQKSQEEKLK